MTSITAADFVYIAEVLEGWAAFLRREQEKQVNTDPAWTTVELSLVQQVAAVGTLRMAAEALREAAAQWVQS